MQECSNGNSSHLSVSVRYFVWHTPSSFWGLLGSVSAPQCSSGSPSAPVINPCVRRCVACALWQSRSWASLAFSHVRLEGICCVNSAEAFWCSQLEVLCISAFGNVFAGWKIFGRGTSSFATPTTHTPADMNPSLGPPNWVGGFVHFVFGNSIVDWCFFRPPAFVCACGLWKLMAIKRDVIFRAACMASSCTFTGPFASHGPQHLHAASPSPRDVLQVGTAR